ncbi:Neural cell adhesion molecule 1-A [Lamellibrachia satsuma]|nr:Neural cell adhesion molecule 1-A [Lamellibrachia satsuma]
MQVAIVFASALCSVYAQEPQITKQILPEIKRVGTTGYLNCSVTRQGTNNKVNWIHRKTTGTIGQDSATIISVDNKIDIDESLNRVQDGNHKYDIVVTTSGETNTYMLIIRRLELKDAGTYTCKVLVQGQEQSTHPSKDGKMVVLLPPTISPGSTTHVKTVKEGDSVQLKCDADGYPKPNITWVRANGKPLPSPINKFSQKGNILNLINITHGDRGVYRCIADNAVRPPATYDATLYINFKPNARPVQSSYGQAENRMYDITIECIIAGYPFPDLTWYQVDKKGTHVAIKDDEKHVIHVLLSHGQTLSVAEVWYQMTIINVQANDYGNYICEGRNRMGHHGGKVHLYETPECQGANCPPEASVVNSVNIVSASAVIIVMTLVLAPLLTH